jgi:hypothetical protein
MRRIVLGLAIVVALITGLLIAFAFLMSDGPDTTESDDPHDVTLKIPAFSEYGGPRYGRHLDISPDGKTTVYVGSGADGSRRLFAHTIGETVAVEIPGLDTGNRDLRDPTFSSDGRHVAYWAQEEIKQTSLDGKEVVVLGKAPTTRGIAWLDSGILVLGNPDGGLLRLSTSDAGPSPLVESKGPTLPHVAPQVLPGNKAVLCTIVYDTLENARIGLVLLETGEERSLFDDNGFSPRYLPTGHILFARGPKRELMAVRFNLAKLEVFGEAKPVMNVPLLGSGHATDYAISETGVLVYTPNREISAFDELAWFGGHPLTEIHVRLKWFEELRRLLP